ncbi:glycosyltransferase family 61 protein [Canariomyces notabilis]|uniref:EGF domain-specific O-linked N-acetylglucosamine transferase n=1 Tax=Canariomyces notabilis TaxID=2074819 RepID=A0AAN6YW02_9PEZI|nr:glycosyltransferase family 61 protein [Canariomyces arenarius]
MAFAGRSMFTNRRRIQSLGAAVLLVFVVQWLHPLSSDAESNDYPFKWQSPLHDRGKPALDLPSEYNEFLEHAIPQSEYCNERFTPRYLDDFRTHAIQYCAAGSAASLHCFQGQTRPNNVVDSICIGQGATLDVAGGKFALDCELRAPDANETSRGLMPFDGMKPEWYETGSRWIFDHFVKVERGSSGAATMQSTTRSAVRSSNMNPQFALLVKREGSSNIWHGLMEIWSMMMTFDLLRTSPNPSRKGAPFFADRSDLPNAQALVLDDLPDGNLFDLWTIFTGRPPVRWKDLVGDAEQARAFVQVPRNIIIPLPGAANPLWQNDWVDHDCGYAPMLKTFVHRVLRFYGISTDKDDESPRIAAADHVDANAIINITFIDRTGSRRLLEHEALLAAVAARHPRVRVKSVDFSTIPFAEQLQLVRETDLLLGVHGAGLTHTMFMRDGRGAVVEIRPATNDYRGFRNLAFMKDLRYLTAYAEQVPRSESSDGDGQSKRSPGMLVKRDSWHWDDVRIEPNNFMELMDAAIAALSHPRRGI